MVGWVRGGGGREKKTERKKRKGKKKERVSQVRSARVEMNERE